MKRNYKQIYQFKITLQGIKPPVWRRIQVPEVYTFWDLHVAIQDAMGWWDSHLHEFKIINPETMESEEIGIPVEDNYDDDFEILAGWQKMISDYYTIENKKSEYIYDFGDDWIHIVVLEV
ncbi:MAG: plasmid pRiA4b ORF-3 family protein [Nitrospirae bacterium]|nr:plasmid pRiA4b ORF-3 family protein [Nitrospirota bacterium]